MVVRAFTPKKSSDEKYNKNWRLQQELNEQFVSHSSVYAMDKTKNGTYLQEPYWDDLTVEANAFVISGANAPVWGTPIGNIGLWEFGTNDEAWFTKQLPHSWQEGTGIRPHVHWAPTTTGTGTIIWGLDYALASPNQVFPSAQTTIYATDNALGTTMQHFKCRFNEIKMTNQKISCMIIGRLFRSGGTYAGRGALLELDFHILKNSRGSKRELTK